MHLPQTQRTALTDLAAHNTMRRCRGPGYRATTPGFHDIHSVRTAHALVRAGLAAWADGETELRITTAGLRIASSSEAAA